MQGGVAILVAIMSGMSCIVLDAKAILDNYFGSPQFSRDKFNNVSKDYIEKCSVFISNNLPGYVSCDLSDESIKRAIEDGNYDYDFEGEKFIFNNLDFIRNDCNKVYPEEISNEIEKIIDSFLERKLYDNQIEPVKTLFG